MQSNLDEITRYEGDGIEVFFKNDPFYARRADEWVTLYFSQDSGKVIGSQIKGVSRLCKKISEAMPGFRIVIDDAKERVRVVYLLMAARNLSHVDDELIEMNYRLRARRRRKMHWKRNSPSRKSTLRRPSNLGGASEW